MPTYSRYSRSILGPNYHMQYSQEQGSGSYSMPTANNGWCGRWQAIDTRDILSVYMYWSSITSPGTITIRIETIDSNGKPSGTLYDANATKTFTPTAGSQLVTFTTPPTAGLVSGDLYGLVILTATTGTDHSLLQSIAITPPQPSCVLTASNATTRSNFAVQTNIPMGISFVYEDSIEECPEGWLNWQQQWGGWDTGIVGTNGYGMYVSISHPIQIDGYYCSKLVKVGTAPDLRFRLFNSSNTVVAGSSVTVPGKGLVNNHAITAALTPFTIPAGNYRLILDDPTHASTSGNEYGIPQVSVHATTLMPGGSGATNFYVTRTNDITATPPTWVNYTDHQPGLGLRITELIGESRASVF